MKELKMCVIGAGSTYSPELVDGFFNRQDKMKVKEFALMDIHMERLEIVGGLIQRMCRHYDEPPKVTLTDDMKTAIEGADYVVTQFRVGLLPARAKDERIGLRHGYIGQETTGPGGFAKALRTIPVILEVADMMKKYAPNAKLINFTNPSGIITEAVSRYTDVPVVGLCNGPITTFKRTIKTFGWENDDVFFDYFGLNHLGFIKGIYLNGKDVTDEMFEKILSHPDCGEMLGYPFHKRQALAMRVLRKPAASCSSTSTSSCSRITAIPISPPSRPGWSCAAARGILRRPSPSSIPWRPMTEPRTSSAYPMKAASPVWTTRRSSRFRLWSAERICAPFMSAECPKQSTVSSSM